MVIRYSKRFVKSYASLAAPIQKRAAKSLKQFQTDPRHPALHFEKLASGYRTLRVDKNFRIVLRELDEGGTFELVDVLTHSKVYSVF